MVGALSLMEVLSSLAEERCLASHGKIRDLIPSQQGTVRGEIWIAKRDFHRQEIVGKAFSSLNPAMVFRQVARLQCKARSFGICQAEPHSSCLPEAMSENISDQQRLACRSLQGPEDHRKPEACLGLPETPQKFLHIVGLHLGRLNSQAFLIKP